MHERAGGAVGRHAAAEQRRDQPVQLAAERVDDVEALRLADHGLLDLELARAVAQVDRPHPERPAALAREQQPVP